MRACNSSRPLIELLEMVEDEISQALVIAQEGNDIFSSFNYLHIEQSWHSQRENKREHPKDNLQSNVYGTESMKSARI